MAVKLKAAKRESLKKSANKEIRLSGQVPAVVYGKNKESKNVAVDSIELLKTVRDEGRNAIISLDIENDSSVDVMLHEYQMDPINDQLIHVDFYVVNMAEEMDVAVAIRLEGEAQGSKDGGVLQQPLYEAQVRAKPSDIPEEITVDVSSLGLGEGLTVGDLKVTGSFEILEDPETTVVTIVAPDTMEDIEQAPDESAEPELVGKEQNNSEEA
ncbi:50S ribosomal protein L25/general stress protein Ctc [Oceanobacillus profundus]|uniref:Large ribosomal subunit protein bL25 n=1 Tax=Oceanobacillus profundus TaxID=372463 RepID=A0A417YH88_9BACI|nr:50S ribosomal protein L25/general stress protein Ctc [Oceanobacillus profundus]MCM3398009.1 50S ribosomal protein L25/general stress protein Ctc [Oceanobacillus profundus]MDO6451317.1 50S ribosomal protein L25/general stress protein Ctc [Oceanobacillus profundus]PAE27011.1 50S ribosomal protein L25/general stress protein Ctc [Paenibacillus sp. 7884-2]RHW32176.1 50S ribosomal protein L25/general stress protein Ctc [Oceanobacillus profundus]